MGNAYTRWAHPEIMPDPEKPPSFDPLYGFPNGRKERVMIASEAEMISAKLPLEERDYCAHKKIDHLVCRAQVWPWAYKCAHEKHLLMDCMHEDYLLRMKEFERERRLLVRKQRLEQKAARLAQA